MTTIKNLIEKETTLTDLEVQALRSFKDNDEFEDGVLGTWHDTGIEEKSAKGVLASLAKKHLIDESGLNEHFSYTVWYITSEVMDQISEGE